MMDSKRLMAWLTVAALSTTLLAAPKRIPQSPKASDGEPFRSFRMLDAKLTLLAQQQEALNAAFNPVQVGSRSGGANSARRTTPFSNMNSTAAGIVLLSGGLSVCTKGATSPSGSKCLELCASERRKFSGASVLWPKRKREAPQSQRQRG